ncbi:hypothetical protein ACKVMT_02510 [Halobacteriales archaeon Cl-PHB]
MTGRTLGLSLAAGLAAFLLVGAAVTEFALRWVEFSLFVGLPAGLIAGVAMTAAVYWGLAADAPTRRHRVAVAAAAFGVTFVAVLVVVAAVLRPGVVASLVGAALVATLVAVGLLVRE